jgi:FixJ family two-component response regulator
MNRIMQSAPEDDAPVPDISRISVVDDDPSIRQAIRGLLRSVGFEARVFASAEEFLTSGGLSGTTCLVLDVRMPGMSGIELQERLIASGHRVPIIFITAHADEDERARALRRGAIACLQKPFSDDALLGAIARANGVTSPA